MEIIQFPYKVKKIIPKILFAWNDKYTYRPSALQTSLFVF